MFTNYSANSSVVNDCEACSRQEECYGLKLDAIFTRYPRAVDVVEEKDIPHLKRFVSALEAVCIIKGQGISQINSIFSLYSS